jgi:CTP:molybdopterin cytidylyltransferase MocA
MAKANVFERQAALQQKEATRPKAKVRNESQAPCRQGKVGHPLYLDADVHRMLKELSLEHERPVVSFLIEGVNLVMHKYGRKVVA